MSDVPTCGGDSEIDLPSQPLAVRAPSGPALNPAEPNERVARLEARVDGHGVRLEALETRTERLDAEHYADREKLHTRITHLEVRVAYWAGGAAAVGGMLGTLIGLLTGYLFK